MIGPFLNSGAIVLGGIIGYLLHKYVPKRLAEGLPLVFSLAALSLGITMIIKVSFMPVVVLALVFGTVIGELMNMEENINRFALKVQEYINRFIPHKSLLPDDEFSHIYSTLLVLFSVSSLGIIGSMTEGISGNYQLLLIKSILDFFTAMIFALSLGPTLVLIFIPQLLIQSSLFLMARLIMPYMDDVSYGDFSACGGIILLAVGFRMAKIRSFPVVNYIPAVFLVVPLSYLWRYFFG